MKYRRLNSEDITVGMRVVLTTDRYGSYPNNPMVGGRHECVGTVDYVDWGNTIINDVHVAWDNGETNTYKVGDLSVEDGGEGVYVDMWRDLC